MARWILTAIALAGMAGCSNTPARPQTSDEMIAIGARELDQHIIDNFVALGGSEEEDAPADIDFGSVFGGATSPTISGGVAGAPTSGVGGTGSPTTGTGGVGEPTTGVGGVGSPSILSTDSFARAVCDFLAALCDYFGRCGVDPVEVGECQAFAGSQCPGLINAALAEAAVTQVPAAAVTWINCATQTLNSAACSPDDESVFADAFFQCLPAGFVPSQEPVEVGIVDAGPQFPPGVDSGF